MPFGMPKNMGGDSPENVKFMERCVSKVMEQGRPKDSAIAICKSQFMKMHKRDSKSTLTGDEPIIVDYDIINDVLGKINFTIRTLMLQGNSFDSARTLCHDLLAKANYDMDVFKSIIDNEVRK